MMKRKLIQYITVLSAVAMMLATWDGAVRGPTAATARSTRGSTTTSPRSAAGPAIHTITTNLADYPDSQVPRYEKLEVTFQVETVAENPDLPYDATPPPGIGAGIGITVNALFTPDNWQTIYTQPAFYYQDFAHEVKSGKEWIYPTGNFSWKVRFAPDQTGSWQFKLMAQDASGTTETDPQTFTVAPSDNKGFLRVSQKDSRYLVD